MNTRKQIFSNGAKVGGVSSVTAFAIVNSLDATKYPSLLTGSIFDVFVVGLAAAVLTGVTTSITQLRVRNENVDLSP